MHGLTIIIDILWIDRHKMIFYGLTIKIDNAWIGSHT